MPHLKVKPDLFADSRRKQKIIVFKKNKKENMASLLLHLEYIKLALLFVVVVFVKRRFRYDDDDDRFRDSLALFCRKEGRFFEEKKKKTIQLN